MSTLYADMTTVAYDTRYLTQADGEQPGQWIGRHAPLVFDAENIMCGCDLAGEIL